MNIILCSKHNANGYRYMLVVDQVNRQVTYGTSYQLDGTSGCYVHGLTQSEIKRVMRYLTEACGYEEYGEANHA